MREQLLVAKSEIRNSKSETNPKGESRKEKTEAVSNLVAILKTGHSNAVTEVTWQLGARAPETNAPSADIVRLDIDGDKKADIVWRHATSGEVWVWMMDGAARLSETWVATVPDTEYRIIK